MKAKIVVVAIAVIAVGYLHPALVKGQPKPERPVTQDVPVAGSSSRGPFDEEDVPFPESEKPDDFTSVTQVLRLKHASAQDLANQIEKLYQIDGVAVAADVRTNQLTVRATKQGLEKVLELVKDLDVPSAQDFDPFQDPFVYGDAGRIQQLSEDPELARIKAAWAEASDQLKEAERRTKDPKAATLIRLRDRVRDLEKQLETSMDPMRQKTKYVDAQGRSSIENPIETKAESWAVQVAAEYRELASPKSVQTGKVDAVVQTQQLTQLKEKLTVIVTTAFEERQQAQTKELTQLRERLSKIEKLIEDRTKNRESIINRRVEELINPNLRWDEDARVLPPAEPRSRAPAPRATPIRRPPGSAPAPSPADAPFSE